MQLPNFFKSLYDFLFLNTKMSWLWLIVRVYVGWAWLQAGYDKVLNPAWVGDSAGGAIRGFVSGALAKTGGEHPDVTQWYAWFLENCVLPNASLWSHSIAYGEVLVGLGLILGAFTFISAFFSFFMSMNFLLAGTVSSNPVMLILALLIMMARKIAGYIGFDYIWLRKSR